MILNEERKQVAEKLRELGNYITEDRFFHWDDAVCESWHAIVKTAGVNNGNPYDDHRELCNRLADLIDSEEFTCQMEPSFITPGTVDDIQEYTCSRCGKQTFSQILGDDEDVPRYCGYCGAKVPENLWEMEEIG